MTERDYGARNRRKHLVRAKTVRVVAEPHAPGLPRMLPLTRGDCANVPRPCPHVSCKHNLYLEVSPGGNIKFNFPDREPDEMPADSSCALDVAERGGVMLEKVAELVNVTRERVRQIEIDAICKMRDAPGSEALEEHHGETIGPGRGLGVAMRPLDARGLRYPSDPARYSAHVEIPAEPSGLDYVLAQRNVDTPTRADLRIESAFLKQIEREQAGGAPELWDLLIDDDTQASRLRGMFDLRSAPNV